MKKYNGLLETGMVFLYCTYNWIRNIITKIYNHVHNVHDYMSLFVDAIIIIDTKAQSWSYLSSLNTIASFWTQWANTVANNAYSIIYDCIIYDCMSAISNSQYLSWNCLPYNVDEWRNSQWHLFHRMTLQHHITDPIDIHKYLGNKQTTCILQYVMHGPYHTHGSNVY